eukprot:scaffold251553_cov31-Tisochrysis_lutea.AAC.3
MYCARRQSAVLHRLGYPGRCVPERGTSTRAARIPQQASVSYCASPCHARLAEMGAFLERHLQELQPVPYSSGNCILDGSSNARDLGSVVVPVREDRGALLGACGLHVCLNELLELRRSDRVDALHLYVTIDASLERVVALLEEVAPAACLTRPNIAADWSKRNHHATRHVLAAVVAGTLNDGLGVGIAHAETFARTARGEKAAARGSRVEAYLVDGPDADAAAVHGLANVVVGVTTHLEIKTIEAAEAERLAGAALEDHVERTLPALVAVGLGNGTGDARCDGTVNVCDGHRQLDVLVLFDGTLDVIAGQELVIKGAGLRPWIGRLRGPVAVCGNVGHLSNVGEVQIRRLVKRALTLLQKVSAADDLGEGLVAEMGEDLSGLLSNVQEETEHVVRHADKLSAEGLLLRGDPDRAIVSMADARHHAADSDHGDGAEAEFVGAEERAHDNVVASLKAAVDAQDDAIAELIEEESLMSLGQAELPWAASVLNRSEGRGAGAAIVARDLDDVGVGLGDAGGHSADADLTDKLHRDLGRGIDLVQIVDELSEVLD